MLSLAPVLLPALALSAAANPITLTKRQEPFELVEKHPWNAGAVNEFRIHSSCNASEAFQLRQGLNEAVELAQHAKDHVNRWAHESSIYTKYFGTSAPTTDVLGAFDIVVNGNKARSIFRCDDPDGVCAATTWGGHYRGENATEETVICPTSFFERRSLSTLCAQGYNVRETSRLIFWASDLLHRVYHLPEIGQGIIDHYAEGWDGIIEAAANNSANTTIDSDGLQYFALEAYAHDIILPGEGCPGPSGPSESTSSSSPAATTTESATTLASSATSAADVTTTESAVPTETSAAADAATTDVYVGNNVDPDAADNDHCHSHADGSLHCS